MFKQLLIGFSVICILQMGGCSLTEPNDFETCEAQAAKDAKTNQALSILVNKCALDFPARKRADGTYVYYDSASNQNYLVKGAKISGEEWKWIELERQKKTDDELKAKAEYQQKQKDALKNVSVSRANATCVLSIHCSEKVITANIKNESKYHITSVSVGWVLGAQDLDCSRSMSTSASSLVSIAPGGHAVLTWKTYDGPQSIANLCFDVVGVGVE